VKEHKSLQSHPTYTTVSRNNEYFNVDLPWWWHGSEQL